MDVVFVTLRSLSFEYGRQDSVLKLGYMLIEWIYDVSILSQSKKKKFIFKLYFDQILKIIINFTWQAHTSYNIIRQFLKVLVLWSWSRTCWTSPTVIMSFNWVFLKLDNPIFLLAYVFYCHKIVWWVFWCTQ